MDGEFRADLHVICRDGQVQLDNFIFPVRGRLMATGTEPWWPTSRAAATRPTCTSCARSPPRSPRGDPVPTSAAHAVVTMRLIDDAYRAAGLAPRPADGQG